MRLVKRAAAALRRLFSKASESTSLQESESAQKPAPPSEPAFGVELQREADRVREAAKWLIASFAAIATILLAGTQFSSIGSLPAGWRLVVAVGGAAAALAGIGALIWLLFDVMMPSEVSLSDMVRHERVGDASPLGRYLAANKEVLMGFSSVRELHESYVAALERRHQALTEYYAILLKAGSEEGPTTKKAEARALAADAEVTYLDGIVGYAAKLLSVEQLRQKIGVGKRLTIFAGAVVVGAGIGLFAWAANPPSAENGGGQKVTLAGIRLSGGTLTSPTAKLDLGLGDQCLETSSALGGTCAAVLLLPSAQRHGRMGHLEQGWCTHVEEAAARTIDAVIARDAPFQPTHPLFGQVGQVCQVCQMRPAALTPNTSSRPSPLRATSSISRRRFVPV